MENPIFSIIVVCLNPGSKLALTMNSIAMQTLGDYEVIIKDGLSVDGTIEALEKSNQDVRIHIYRQADKGIYDAMNQAVEKANGNLVYFLNCGDLFFDDKVLENIRKKYVRQEGVRQILYGNIYETVTGQQVASNPHLDRFGCYRNVPCHQACFYERELLIAHPFQIGYRVRADYEQFLWCALEQQARLIFVPITIARYEGGGFSETRENKKVSVKEHREIVNLYMSKGEVLRYKVILMLTLAPLRTKLAENAGTAVLYQKIKRFLYQNK